MLHDSEPFRMVAVPLEDKPMFPALQSSAELLKIGEERGVAKERERVKAVIDYYQSRIDHNNWSKRTLIDKLFDDIDLGVNYLFENPPK